MNKPLTMGRQKSARSVHQLVGPNPILFVCKRVRALNVPKSSLDRIICNVDLRFHSRWPTDRAGILRNESHIEQWILFANQTERIFSVDLCVDN